MLKNIKGIYFEGAAFEDGIMLQLFSENETECFCLAFGRNGSGKTTIARALLKASGKGEVEDIASVQFVDSQGAETIISDDEKKAIFVFNEDYVNSKVRLREDGLGTIVMFGELGDIVDKIENAEKAISDASSKYSAQSEKYSKYCDSQNVLSPDHHNAQVLLSLKEDDNWAGRERRIMGFRRNASVSEATVSAVMESVPSETKSELLKLYEVKLGELQAVTEAGERITKSVPAVDDYTSSAQKVIGLLAEKIEEPKLSEREQKLLSMAQGGKQSRLAEMKAEFSSEADSCSFCLQEVTAEHKASLLESIDKILSKAAEEHKAQLDGSKFQSPTIDLSAFEIVDKDLVDKCLQVVTSLNEEIERVNQAIEQKTSNLYTPILNFVTDLQAYASSLAVLLVELNKEKDEYNARHEDIPQIRIDLQVINKKIAYYEIKDSYTDYIKQKSEKDAEKRLLDALELALRQAKNELSDLNQQKKSIKIAVDFINNGLKYVFFSEDRLTVHIVDDHYMLRSNGKDVRPKNISVGERNILALCYFFTEMLHNVDEKDAYKAEHIVVLDDPVSSFDLENRVGIISYLKSQILKILRGNTDSRIVLLTHDLLTAYDLDKALREVAEQIKVDVDGNEKKITHRFVELDKNGVQAFSWKKRNEYSQLLQAMYEYASSASDEYELAIGNIMRKALEAFGTFQFQKGIAELSYDPEILLSINDEEKRDYFENLMYRLILNGESHLTDRTKLITDNNFFATISSAEKRRTAKDILCLMYLLNSGHIKAQFNALKNEVGDTAVSDIEGWISAINPTVARNVSNG